MNTRFLAGLIFMFVLSGLAPCRADDFTDQAELLESSIASERNGALYRIAQLKNERVPDVLLGVLANDEVWYVRQNAVSLLAKSSDARALPALKKAFFSDASVNVRGTALSSLAAFVTQFPEVEKLLLDGMNDPAVEIRRGAFYGLVSLAKQGRKFPEIVPRLLAGLDDADYDIRMGAVMALKVYQEPSALERLLRTARTDPVPARRRDTPLLLSILGDKRAIEPLYAMLADPYQQVRKAATGALKTLGATDDEIRQHSAASPVLFDPELIRLLSDRDEQMRLAALSEMDETCPDSRLQAFVRLLRNDASPKLRTTVAERLEKCDTPLAVNALTEASQADRPAELRAVALRTLGKMRDAAAIPALLDALNDPSAEICKSVLDGIAYIGLAEVYRTPQIQKVIVRLMHGDPDAAVRYKALEAIAGLNSAAQVVNVAQSLADRDVAIRRRAAAALESQAKYQSIMDESVIPLLARALNDRSAVVRKSVASVLGVYQEISALEFINLVREGKVEEVRGRLARGGNANVKDRDGNSALHVLAEAGGAVALLDALVAKGADIEALNAKGETPLHVAAAALISNADGKYSCADDLLGALVRHGAKVNVRSKAGAMPLHLAVRHCKPESISLLIEHGALVNATDNQGDTPLHVAAREWSTPLEVVMALVSGGADASLKNSGNKTALDVASTNSVKQYLEKYGTLSRREQLAKLTGELSQAYVSDADAKRQQAIRLAMSMTPPPAIPEEARRQMAEGQAALKLARDPAGFGEAASKFEKATNLAPWWPDAYFNLALTYEKQGKIPEALKNLELYLQVSPDAPDAAAVNQKRYEYQYLIQKIEQANEHINRGVEFYNAGNTEGSIAEYKEAIRIYPESVRAHGNLGTAYGKLERYQESIPELREAIRLGERVSYVYASLARSYNRLGDRKQAIGILEECLKVCSYEFGRGLVYQYLCGYYEAEGQRDNAKKSCKIALNLSDIGDKEVKRQVVLDVLNRLGN